ncbi:MAG: IS5 family transposase [Pseudomonadota bacterium]
MAEQSDPDRLTDAQWERLAPLMPGGTKGKRGPRTDNRRFMNAVLWMARSGARWRDLPDRFGDYQTVKRRYYDWVKRDVFTSLFRTLSEDSDLEWMCIDATVIRAHQHASGAPRKKGGLMPKVSAAPGAA